MNRHGTCFRGDKNRISSRPHLVQYCIVTGDIVSHKHSMMHIQPFHSMTPSFRALNELHMHAPCLIVNMQLVIIPTTWLGPLKI
ncbi:hypothetical protein FKM82_009230 [Ascaphus truei]